MYKYQKNIQSISDPIEHLKATSKARCLAQVVQTSSQPQSALVLAVRLSGTMGWLATICVIY